MVAAYPTTSGTGAKISTSQPGLSFFPARINEPDTYGGCVGVRCGGGGTGGRLLFAPFLRFELLTRSRMTHFSTARSSRMFRIFTKILIVIYCGAGEFFTRRVRPRDMSTLKVTTLVHRRHYFGG